MALIVGTFFGRPAVAEATPYRPSQRFFARDQGLAGYEQGFEDGVASVVVDINPPVVTLLSPGSVGVFPGASRAERRGVPVRIRVHDAAPGLRHVMLIVTYAGDPHVYVAYDSSQDAGDGFVAEFLSSKRDVIETGDEDLEVQLWPTGGWPGDPRIRVVAFDQAGNVELAP